MDSVIAELIKIFPKINMYIMAGTLVFARLVGFFRYAPIFNRKDFPTMAKIPLAILISIFMVPMLSPEKCLTECDSFVLSIVLNIVVGAIVGFVAQLITVAIESGAEIMNMQMGLSSATVLDPTTSSQKSILTNVIALMGLIIFINVGGVYWMFNALLKSFTIFPMYSSHIPLENLVKMDLLIKLSSNTLYLGLQIASPVLLATLAQDIILGVISRTAPQVNVFNLSFLFKPILGAAVLIWILPMLMNIIEEYFLSCAGMF